LNAQGSRFRVQGSGFRVQGSRFKDKELGFKVQSLRVLGFVVKVRVRVIRFVDLGG
jgi:hypothetical protein